MGQDESAPRVAPADEATLQPCGRVLVADAVAGLWNLGRLQRGHGDPTLRRHGELWWRASTTPEGPVLLRFAATVHPGQVEVVGWGEGTRWALAQAPRLLGTHDQDDGFAELVAGHPVLGPLARRHLPLGATDLLTEVIAPSVIEQKVTGAEAFTSYRLLVRRFGRPAPGPAAVAGTAAHGMVCPPTAPQWASVPSWEFLQAGVEDRRAQALVRVLHRVAALERLLATSQHHPSTRRGQLLEQAMTSLPGIGPWTAARVRQGVLGDPDAWSVDDYHVPGLLARALSGSEDPADAVAALEPLRPHRYRVEVLVARARLGSPQRRGPRRTLPTHLPVRGAWNRRVSR